MLSLSAMLAAMVFVMTAYVHVPTGRGYTHAGDGIIFLAASLLPTPYAVAAGAVGAALADGLSGFVIWIPATVIIKGLTALFFTSKSDKIINTRNIIALLPSLVLCVVGYSLYDGIVIAGKFSAAAIAAGFAQTPAYCVQIIASSILYILLGKGLDKAGIKKKIPVAKKIDTEINF